MEMEMFHEDRIKIPFGCKCIDAILGIPSKCSDLQVAVILTHGAGGDMNFKHVISVAQSVASAGLLSLRFTCKGLNVVYRTKAYRAVLEYLKNLERFTLRSIFVGGRSMGARAAAALVKQLGAGPDDVLRGLICLSFPLHPPGQPRAHLQRSEDLRGLDGTPVLFVCGTTDDMCQRNLLEDVVKRMKSPASIHWVDGASHGLGVKGRLEESVLAEVNSCVVSWVLEHVKRAIIP